MKVLKMIAVLTFVLTFIAGCSAHSTKNDKTQQGSENNFPESEKKTMLTVSSDNGYIVDKNGNEIVLKGANLGGWLVQETWMGPIDSSECNLDSFTVLKERGFTDDQIETLFVTYAENYITEKDIEKLSSMGLNCVRLPFWYRNFMDENCEFYSEDHDEIFGFQIIDKLLDWAQKYDMYVILDMHGCPGGQSTDHSCGTIGKNELYTNERYLGAMQELWEAIAERYKNNSTVAAYDIMNEPMNNNTSYENGWAAGSPEAVSHTVKVYDRMIKAIRAIDSEHIITIEGIWSTDMLPDPSRYGWTNMMYQLHLYDTSTEMIDYRVSELVSVRKKYKVAVYVGEFNNGDENQAYAYRKYSQNDLSWTMWTYKVTKNNLGNWSLYSANIRNADLANDSYEEILEKWGSTLNTENFTLNTTVENWLKTFAKR